MKLLPAHCGAASAAALLVSMSTVAAGATDNKAVMANARRAYYALDAHGFHGFECKVTPNWELLLGGAAKKNPANATATLKLLNQIEFTVVFRADGAAKVTHNSVKPANDRQASSFKMIYHGIEQTLDGFFSTWSLFVKSPPLPAPTYPYELTAHDNGWHLRYKEGASDVATEMAKDFAIREIKVTTSDFVSTVRPQFAHTRDGLLLNAYHGDYRQPGQQGGTRVDVRIAYHEVDGLQVPAQMAMSGLSNTTPLTSELNFSDCRTVRN